jgi:hypothetical protein
LLLFLLINSSLFAQEKNEIIQQRIEFLSEQNGVEELDLTNVFEQLSYYLEHPINLNTASVDELKSLQLLSDIQISDLLLHIKQFGKLISIYELQSLTYWDLPLIEQVLPFVRVDDKLDQLYITFHEAIKNGRFDWILRYQRTPEFKQGYTKVSDSILATSNKYYQGNADHYYARFRYTYRTNLSAGITADKDPGEAFFNKSQPKGFDFYSAHLYYKGGKYIQTVALGDYLVQVGQGLNTWSGYAFGKTADVFSSKRTANLLRPYTSVDENRFFRGAATVLGYKRFSLLTFVSQKRIDGTTTNDSLPNSLDQIGTIDFSGLHRTNAEIAKKNRFTERVAGSYLTYRLRTFTVGLAAVHQQYDAAINKDSVPYNNFAFRGTATTTLSSDYNFTYKNANFFGEVSYASHNHSFALLHGVLAVLDPRVSVSIIYRNYQPGYHSFYNNGFSEGTATQNEKGLFLGSKVKIAPTWTLNMYADFFRFPWLKYQVDAPSSGVEFLFQPVYRPSKTLEIYGRFRLQIRQKNSRDSDGTLTPIENVTQRNYRLNMNYQVSEAIQLKSRVEYVTINRPSNTPEKGWIMTQDIVMHPKSKPFDLSLRYALFETDSYDSRIYTFENNAIGVFSVPAYYYQGSRAYCLIRYTFLKHWDFWLKYGTNIFSDRTTIGSGAEEIKGNRKSDITVQLRLSL